MRMPPPSLALAKQIGNSCTWQARKGAYQTVVMNSMDNPPKGFENLAVFFKANDEDVFDGNATWGIGTASALDLANGQVRIPSQVLTVPYDTSGIYLTGLAPTAIYDLTVHFYIEEFLSSTDPNADLCFQSPAFDQKAMLAYCQLANKLPACVPLDWNYKGEWVANLLSFVSKISTPVGAALNSFIPGAGVAGSFISKGASYLADKTERMYNIPT